MSTKIVLCISVVLLLCLIVITIIISEIAEKKLIKAIRKQLDNADNYLFTEYISFGEISFLDESEQENVLKYFKSHSPLDIYSTMCLYCPLLLYFKSDFNVELNKNYIGATFEETKKNYVSMLTSIYNRLTQMLESNDDTLISEYMLNRKKMRKLNKTLKNSITASYNK